MSAESNGNASSTGSASSTGNASSTSSPSPTSSPISLSVGAKAGIAVGSIAFAIAAIGIIAWYVLRRRRRGGSKELGTVVEADADTRPQSLPKEKPAEVGVNERLMPRSNVYEMGNNFSGAAELPSDVTRSELGDGARNENDSKQWVDDRAAAGYDGAYRGH